MKKVLFVCHGNICRSPMAEVIFRELLVRRGLTDRFTVDSAAVSSEELGNPVYPSAQQELTRRGLPASDHRAWQLSRADYDRYDYFVAMDMDNAYRMLRIFGGDEQCKISLLLGHTNRPGDVEDPWFTFRFDYVFDEITRGCEALLTDLLKDERGAQS
ncbi:MAG: low molecular weight protein-tyrosine-phosphatase [Aristaeellaceae bacterium]